MTIIFFLKRNTGHFILLHMQYMAELLLPQVIMYNLSFLLIQLLSSQKGEKARACSPLLPGCHWLAMATPTTPTHLSRSFAWLLPSLLPASAIWAGKAAGWNMKLKLVPDASSIFVFDHTASPAEIADRPVSAIWAAQAARSKTKLEEASGTN